MKESRVLILDIDNTLADYTKAWLDFLKEKTGRLFHDIAEAKAGLDPELYKEAKAEYRASGRKRSLPLLGREVPALLQRLSDDGWKIAVVSSRPAQSNPLVANDTIIWLVVNSIPTDYMYFTDEKSSLIKRLFKECEHCAVVEDEPEFALSIAAAGFEVLYVGREVLVADRLVCCANTEIALLRLVDPGGRESDAGA